MRKFKKTVAVRKFKITASPRKLFGRVTGNIVIDPTPFEGPYIWGRDDVVIDQTPGSYKDYP